MNYVIGHISAKYHQAFMEISRVLKLGGYFLFDCDNKWKLFLKFQKDRYQRALQTPMDIGYNYHWRIEEGRTPMLFKTFTNEEVHRILQNNGLEIVKTWSIGGVTSCILPALASPFKKSESEYDDIHLGYSVWGRIKLWSFSRLDYLFGKLPYFSKKAYTNIILAKKVR